MNVNKYLVSICFVYSLLFFGPLLPMQISSDVNAVDAEGCTKLHYACIAGNEKEVESLISQGAAVNIKTISMDAKVPTPLECAAMAGSSSIITLLLDAGASVDSAHNIFENTPLHFATWFGHPDCVKLLISRGASVEARNNKASTPGFIAVWRNESECLAILLEYGADAENENKTGNGRTLLYSAATLGSVECLRVLIRHLEGDTGLINQSCKGDTPLLSAAGMLHPQCCWDLIKAGALSSQPVWPSTKVRSYSAFKNFLENIEQNAKPAYLNYAGKMCLLCNHEFVSDDVILQLNAWTSCGHVFHERCFQDSAVKKYIEKNRNNEDVIQLFQEYEDLPFDSKKIMHLVEQSVRSNRVSDPQSVKQCPLCQKPLSCVLGSLAVVR